MQNRSKKLLWLAVTLLVAGVIGWLILGGKSTGAAEKYKAELRAKGEKISFADLGFPKTPEIGDSLSLLTNAVLKIGQIDSDPVRFLNSDFKSAGRMHVRWRGEAIALFRSDSDAMQWSEFSTLIHRLTNELATIRAASERPIRWFQYDPPRWITNNSMMPLFPFVEFRSAPQWLYADGIEALHTDDLVRAKNDILAMIQLAEFNHDEPTLIAAMVHVAISGLNLDLTWQAMLKPGWSDADLAQLQLTWSKVDTLKAVENGFFGVRATTEIVFEVVRDRGFDWLATTYITMRQLSVWEQTKNRFQKILWDPDADELLMQKHQQFIMQQVRALHAGASWPGVLAAVDGEYDSIAAIIADGKGINRFRYVLSEQLIPSLRRAIQTGVRCETQRRLTITAIALQRFQLRHQRWPEKLEELTPEFLAFVPMDPMSAEPLRYRREADGGFVLYSVGEDGKDDGGDPAPVTKVSQHDWWTGRDTVWPKPAN